jgi:isopentenyl-diphosphate Delta-isomerase
MTHDVVLVDEYDNAIGSMEKIEAHQKALLHRAFSVFIFNKNNEMLLQQRAITKYHSGGLWTNACCSHPYTTETVETAANRRLQEELGFTTELQKVFSFTYMAQFDNGLTEHEYDHVFIGQYEGNIQPNSEEVESFCYKAIAQIEAEIINEPQKYTSWFKIALPKLKEWLLLNNNKFL